VQTQPETSPVQIEMLLSIRTHVNGVTKIPVFLFFTSILILPFLVTFGHSKPEQIHLSYGDVDNSMYVSWSTPIQPSSTLVTFTELLTNTTSTVKGTSEHFKQLLNSSHPLNKCTTCVDEYLHTAYLTNLVPGSKYQYMISGDSVSYTFTNVVRNAGRLVKPFTFGVYGDMGTVIPGGSLSPSLKYLIEETNDGTIDGILHVGDLAYDMDDHGGTTGAEFFRQIQPVASKVPYMTVPGNHEGGTPYFGALKHYVHRLHMPNYEKGRNSFYSFNVGPVHIVSFSSEAYFWQYWQIVQQFEWLENDLKSVDRTETPFIITQAHRPMYCSNSDDADDCTKVNSTMRRGIFSGKTHEKDGLFALEPLFNKYKVDLCFWAHEHSYERTWPVYNGQVMNGSYSHPYVNPKAPVHIVAGAAGCREGHDQFNGPKGEWSAYRNSNYGYGRLRIANNTHIHWEQIEDVNKTIIDELWLVKDARLHRTYTRPFNGE
jgi:acid phosphatase type 7